MVIEHIPYSSDRLTDDERERVRKHLCARQTGYGLPWIEYCSNTLTSDEGARGSIECKEHERDNEDQGHHVLRVKRTS